jgi:glutaredoxin
MSQHYTLVVREQDCTWCNKAEALLQRIGAPYTKLTETDPEYTTKLRHLVPPHHTVPMLFSYNEFVGGYTDLAELLGEAVPRY